MIYVEQDREIKSTYLEQKTFTQNTFATSKGKKSATHDIQKEKTKQSPKSQVFDKMETRVREQQKRIPQKPKIPLLLGYT